MPKGVDEKKSISLRLLGEANKKKDFKFPQKSTYVKIYANALADKYNLEYKVAKNLIKTYGVRAFDVLQLAQQQKNYENLSQKLHPDHPFLKAEVLYSIRCEMAQYPLDVLFRRTRLGFLDRKAAFESLKSVCDIFAVEKGWDAKKTQQVYLDQQEQLRKLDF